MPLGLGKPDQLHYIMIVLEYAPAATRIGLFAGVKASDVHIYHDSGPGTAQTEYCTTSTDTLASVAEGDRIDVKVNTAYSPIVPILPIGSMTLKSDSTHTILTNVGITAATPQNLPNIFTCPITPFAINETNPIGTSNTISIINTGSSITLKTLLIIWDTTSGPLLTKIIDPNLNVINLSQAGPVYSQNINWLLSSNTSTPTPTPTLQFTINFSKTLKNNVIIRLTFETTLANGDKKVCSFGR